MTTEIRQTSVTAVISLVFGIACWVLLPLVGAIVAVVTGHVARSEIRRAPDRLEGDGLALAGLILGWGHLVLAVAVLLFVFLFLGGIAFFTALVHH
ncbi:MAG: DUF4190 domain-containing protein [Luteitalea sp.]|nr:DUF4190 domain-containing protein [Luteitalea sp.]